MTKPRPRPRRQSVEQEPAKDEDARLETFERVPDRQQDDVRTDTPDSIAPANDRLDAND